MGRLALVLKAIQAIGWLFDLWKKYKLRQEINHKINEKAKKAKEVADAQVDDPYSTDDVLERLWKNQF